MSSSAPSSSAIIAELQASGHLPPHAQLELIPLPANPLRADHSSRLHYHVRQDGRTSCYLTAGHDLAELHRRTAEFADACPRLACRPLFLHRTKHWHFLGTEFFDGDSIEALVRIGRLSPARARPLAASVLAELNRTTARSNVESVQNELDQILPAILALPHLGELDRIFLQAIVFPLIRTGAGTNVPQTRWTNGDFIARNVLVNRDGDLRLIDCELAERTHFSATDIWRWRTYSNVPEELRTLSSAEPPLPAWLEMLAILRQVVHQFEINGPAIAIVESRAAIDRIIALTATVHGDFHDSVFFRTLASNTLPNLARRAGIVAQLYWATEGEAFQEFRSQRHEYLPEETSTVRFRLRNLSGRIHLRLDPSEAPGVLAVSHLTVRTLPAATTQLERNPSTGWSGVAPVSGLLLLPDERMLRMLCLDTDPHFVLPVIDLGPEPTDIECEFHLRFSRDLTELPTALGMRT